MKSKSKLKANVEAEAGIEIETELEAAISATAADSKLKIKGVKTNKFRFESYIDRLSAIELKVGEDEIWNFGLEDVEEDKWYSEDGFQDYAMTISESEAEDYSEMVLEHQVKEQLSRTAFGDSLKYWEGTVRYSEFVDLVKVLKPYRYSLVHIIQYLEFIIKELTRRINECEYPETAEAISFLIGAIAKDTRLELFPMLPTIFEALSIRLETPFNEVSITGQGGVGLYNEKVIQSVFSCTSTIFFYLSSYILRDLTNYLSIYRRWIYHSSSVIRHFSSESIAYALKKSKDQEIIKSLDMIFQFSFNEYNQASSKTVLLNKWLSEVVANVIFSINGCISSQGELVLRYLYRHLGFGLQIESKYLLNRTETYQQEQEIISSFLASINDGENVRNYNFESSCNLEFRKSFTSLNLILKDILDHINDHISDTANVESLQEVLSTLISIYLEILDSFSKSRSKSNIRSDLNIEYITLSLITCIQMITNTCYYHVNSTNIRSESIAYKKKKFRFNFGIVILHFILSTIRNGLLKALCIEVTQTKIEWTRVLSQLILSYMDLVSKITMDGIILHDSNCIHVLAYSDFKLPQSNSFIQVLSSTALSLTFADFTERYSDSHSWSWLKTILESCKDIKQVQNRSDLIMLVMNSALSIFPIFNNYNHSYSELESFMKIVLEYQKILLEDFLKSKNQDCQPSLQILANILKFIGQAESFGIKSLYLNNSDLSVLILRSCKFLIVNQDLELCNLYIILELLSYFFLEKDYILSLNLDSNYIQDLKSDLLVLYTKLFKSKLDENTGVLDTFESLESIQVFKLFCLVFSRFEMNQITLTKMASKIKFWMNLNDSLFLTSNIMKNSVSIISTIPLEYDSEIISIMDILLKSTLGGSEESNELENPELMSHLEAISLCWIINPLYEVRKKISIFLFNFLSKQRSTQNNLSDLVQGVMMIVNLEDCEANIENERTKIRKIQQICDHLQLKLKTFSSGSDVFLFKLIIRSVISQLYIKLSLIWKPCTDILIKLVKSIQESEGEESSGSEFLLETILSTVLNQIYYSTYRIRKESKTQDEVGLPYTDEFTLIEWCCKLLAQIKFSDFEKYPDLVYFQAQILYWLIQNSFELEGNQDQFALVKGEDVIQQFCSNYGVQILDLFSRKGQIQRTNHFIHVLEAMLFNQKGSNLHKPVILEFLLNKFLVECAPSLLYINHIELQMSLINVICEYGKESESLIKYKSMFQSLISGSSRDGQIQSLRSNLLSFSLSIEKEDIIKREDRIKVIPIVIRVLLSKLGKDKEGLKKSNDIVRASKKGNKALSSSSKRKVIISYLSELPKEEMSLLLSVIIDPLVNVKLCLDDSFGSKQDSDFEVNHLKDLDLSNILKRFSPIISEASEVELKGYYKSFLLNDIISQDNIHKVSKFWTWNKSCSQNVGTESVDLGFVYTSKDLLLSQGKEHHSIPCPCPHPRKIKISIKHINIYSSQYKVVLRFLSYLDHLLNFMSHTIKDHIHVILIILTNILYLNHNMVKITNHTLEYENCTRELSLNLQNENQESTGFVIHQIDDPISEEDEEKEVIFTSSLLGITKKEDIQRKVAINRVRMTCKQVFISISAILSNYSEFASCLKYLVSPISPLLLSSFETNLKSSSNLHISSIMSLMINLSNEETLFDFYSCLFPKVLLDFSVLFSAENILAGITHGIPGGSGERSKTGSEFVISTIISMYLNILLGGQERFVLFQESVRKNNLILSDYNNTRLVIGDFSSYQEEEQECTISVSGHQSSVKSTSSCILVSKKGLELVSGCIPTIIDSLQKVMLTRNLKRTNNRQEIITFKELILLKILALVEINRKSCNSLKNGGVKDYREKTIIQEYLSIMKIILLLLLSTISKVHSKNERVANHNWSVFNLISSMLRVLDLNIHTRKYNQHDETTDRFCKDKLIERIGSLIVVSDKDLVNGESSDFNVSFLILISDIMSYLLLKTPNLKLRSTISEIFLFSELSLSGKGAYFNLVLDSMNDYCEKISRKNDNLKREESLNFEGFSVKSVLFKEKDVMGLNQDVTGNLGILIPLAIYGLNKPSNRKRVLGSSGDIDLQLDILKDLEEILELDNCIRIFNKDLRLLYPLVSQQLYFIGGNESGEYSISSLSSRFIKKLILSWCNSIKTIVVLDSSKTKMDNNEKDVMIRYILNVLLNLVIPYQEEVVRYSQDLLVKRNILQLVGVIIENFTPLLDKFTSKMGISRDLLVEKFHLSLFPIISYITSEDNEEVRLFEELTHIQKHRRARSLNFFARFSKFSFEKFGNTSTMGSIESEILYLGKYKVRIPVRFYTIKTLGVPLALDALLQKGSGKETYSLSLGDNSLRSIETFALFFDWRYCINLTGYLIKLLRLFPQRKTYIIKAICSLLNSFDFQINELVTCNILDIMDLQQKVSLAKDLDQAQHQDQHQDQHQEYEQSQYQDPGKCLGEQLSEMQTSIKQKLMPLLRSIMVDRSYKIDSKSEESHIINPELSQKAGLSKHSSQQYGIIRSDIVLIIIRVLRCLPSKQFHSELPRLITQLIMALKSKDREIRRSSRSSLKSISKTLGVQYLPWIFTQMSSILTTGYQLPVLIFTVHSILHEISISLPNLNKSQSNPILFDDCIQILSKMVIEELNRIADPDKRTTSFETIDTPMTGSVDEGKYIRSPQIIRIISKYVSLHGAEKLFQFLEDLLSGKLGDREDASIISDSFSQKYLYWLKNLYFQFCIGFINNENFGQNTKLKFSIYNLAKGVVIDKNMVKNNDIYVLISSINRKILNLFQDPLNLVQHIKSGTPNRSILPTSKAPKIDRMERKERYYKVQPGASTGRGTHQVIKRQKGFESKVKSVVLSSSCLYLLNQLLKVVNNVNLPELVSDDENEQYFSINLLLDHLLPLVAINFANESSELASFSCKCFIRVLFIESMESAKNLGILEIDYLGSLISKTALSIMERSGVNSINTSNGMAELISSSMKLFVALLIRPKSAEWFNGLFFGHSLKKTTLFYTNILKQLHITINDNRLRITSLQLLRQIILYGKDQVTLSSDSLGSLYSLVDSVLPLIVQYSSMEPKIVTMGCDIYVDLLLYYPMSEKSQKQRISVLLENLPEYPTSEGRQALLTAIHTLITRFPIKLVMESYNIMFLTGLTLALSTETEFKPRSMIQGIVFDILAMYRNDNQARMNLVTLVFKALGTLGSNLNIKCGLVILLEFILEFFISEREMISIKELGDFEILIFSELNQLVSIFSSIDLKNQDRRDEINQGTDNNYSNSTNSIVYRLEYETINLLNLFLQGEFDIFETINLTWFLKKKVENRRTWSKLWNILIVDNENKMGLESGHLWVKSSLYRLVTNLLKHCLAGVVKSPSSKSEKCFLLEFTLSPKIFTSLFSKIIPLQFSPLLEFAPWLAPKVLVCVQHLILLSNFLKDDWIPPKKLSDIDKEEGSSLGDFGKDLLLSSQVVSSLYNIEPKKGLKKIKISKENEVQEDDWLIIEKRDNSEDYEEDESEEDKFSLSSSLKSHKPLNFTGNDGYGDDIEEALDDFLLSKIPEAPDSNQEESQNKSFEKKTLKEEDLYQDVSLSSSASGLEKKSTIRNEVYWWLIDRISCCSRFYSTRPGNFRTRLLLTLKSLYDMIGFLPLIIKDSGCNWEDPRTMRSLNHVARALYQSSTMLKKQDFTEKGFSIYNITSFDWVQEIQKFGVYQIIGQTCLFAQRTVERWDKVFNDVGKANVLLGCLSEARRNVISSRMERKTKLRLDTVRNPEIAFKRKRAMRERIKENKKRKLKVKIENRKLNRI
ncbi:multidomain with a conserved eukaryotic domain [Cryptosporidium sp. chipmunk genotype I]|uniref:multidomain with a conserved eukaryotic domain n=1 Tax=Cryptosporidium sp. chipmunk genotype I TaxID=1280935 RepID=UPI003519F465|nr:multidomain with a conserved eukaryotic domain [Cryptosporidium sp. chipmunk genotype I]